MEISFLVAALHIPKQPLWVRQAPAGTHKIIMLWEKGQATKKRAGTKADAFWWIANEQLDNMFVEAVTESLFS